LCVNNDLKKRFKKHYRKWRAQQLSSQRQLIQDELNVARDLGETINPSKFSLSLHRDRQRVIQIVQRIFAEFNEEQLRITPNERVIRRTFAKAGQDIEAVNQDEFHKHLQKLTQSAPYGPSSQTLLYRQQPLDLGNEDESLLNRFSNFDL
tara:strand:- start:17 stop:466 length:450 start_codon:yes stop_codon:yes gene_type:complete